MATKHTERTPGGQEITISDDTYFPVRFDFQGVHMICTHETAVKMSLQDAREIHAALGKALAAHDDTQQQDKQPHRYEVGQHVTLINGASAIILSQWHEDDGTPGYGVQTYFGFTTGIHEAHIDKPRTHE